jgi:hypothetical protein
MCDLCSPADCIEMGKWRGSEKSKKEVKEGSKKDKFISAFHFFGGFYILYVTLLLQ